MPIINRRPILKCSIMNYRSFAIPSINSLRSVQCRGAAALLLRGFFSQLQDILNKCQTNFESKYLKMTFKLFNFWLSIFVSLSLFSLSWSVSLKAKKSEKTHYFSLQSEKKIGLFSLIFALSENELSSAPY